MNKCDQVKYEFCLASMSQGVLRALDAAQGLYHTPALQAQVVAKLKEIRALIKSERDAIKTEGSEQHFLKGEKI